MKRLEHTGEYISPQIETLELSVELGFAQSPASGGLPSIIDLGIG